MKRLLVRLAGGYAGLGALAFLVHRWHYLATSKVRLWTESQSEEISRQLTQLQRELQEARRELRRRSVAVQESEDRRFGQKTPVDSSAGKLAA